jgi:methionyl-tRNA formyltransferase
MSKKTAIVFAYHNVGVRCIKVLLARGVDIQLIVTHEDKPSEKIWFASVIEIAREHGIPFCTPSSPSEDGLQNKVQSLQPDFIFSFYYRHMIPITILEIPKFGAYNMHGSLLPKYRGRVPVNWAVLRGETETGATLHEMAVKPDAGDIIAQMRVPILPDDSAYEVFGKVEIAAEQTLWYVLPKLIEGTAPRLQNDLTQGSYFSGRKPEDGRIDWSKPAAEIYNLHRAVAPPYPGVFFEQGNKLFKIVKARLAKAVFENLPLGLQVVDNGVFGVCGDKRALQIIELEYDGSVVSAAELSLLINGK